MIAPLLMAAPDPVVPTGSDAQLILAALGGIERAALHSQLAGAVRVVLHVLNVLNDETNYTLRLEEVAG